MPYVVEFAGGHDCSVWPQEALPALEPAFKATGRLVCDVATAIMGHCDSIIQQRKQHACGSVTARAAAPQHCSGQGPFALQNTQAAGSATWTPASSAAASVDTLPVVVSAARVTDAGTGNQCGSGLNSAAGEQCAAGEPKVGYKRHSPSSDCPIDPGRASSPTCDSSATCCGATVGGSASGDIAACIHVAVSEQKSNKARLLYYYPPDPATYHQAGDLSLIHI